VNNTFHNRVVNTFGILQLPTHSVRELP